MWMESEPNGRAKIGSSSIGSIFYSVVLFLFFVFFFQAAPSLITFVLLTTQRSGDGVNVFPSSFEQLMHVSDSLSHSVI